MELDILNILMFASGYLWCLVMQDVFEYFDRSKKPKNKRWKNIENIKFTFNEPDYDLPMPIRLRTIVTKLIPKIMEIKSEQLDYQDTVIEKGNYDLSFEINVGWKKK